MTEARILIFAKMPRPGGVKTRLVPPLTEVEAAAVHAASLRDVVAGARQTGAAVRILHDEVAGADEYFAHAFPELEREAQSGGDLGHRLSAAFERAFSSGTAAVAAIGADSPTLPTTHLQQGLAATRESGVALGPAADGGYYLIGVRRDLWPEARSLFLDIPWSTARVLGETLQRAAGSGFAPRVLPQWYDIDRIEDLERARRDAPSDSHLARLLAGLRWARHPAG